MNVQHNSEDDDEQIPWNMFFREAIYIIWNWKNRKLNGPDSFLPPFEDLVSSILYRTKETFFANPPIIVNVDLEDRENLQTANRG